MSGELQITPEGSTFEEFHARHRDQSDGKKLGWMADFHRAKEGIILHPKAELKWRVLELAKQTSWGNKNRDYSANEKGQPLTQRDFASVIGVPFQRVNEAVDQLVKEGFLRLKGRIIFVVDDPAAERAKGEGKEKQNNNRPGLSAKERAEYRRFCEERFPEQFQQYQKLGKEIEEKFEQQRLLNEAMWQAYQSESGKSGTGRIIENTDPERGGQNVRNGADKTSGTGRTDGEPILIGLTSNKEQLASSSPSDLEEAIEKAIDEKGLQNLDGVRIRAIRAAAQRIAKLAPGREREVLPRFQSDLAQIVARRENRPKSWGIVVTAMEDAIAAIQRRPAQSENAKGNDAPAFEITAEEQTELLENLLAANPNHSQAQQWREQIEKLKRKPAESEPRAKAQKAGSQ